MTGLTLTKLLGHLGRRDSSLAGFSFLFPARTGGEIGYQSCYFTPISYHLYLQGALLPSLFQILQGLYHKLREQQIYLERNLRHKQLAVH